MKRDAVSLSLIVVSLVACGLLAGCSTPAGSAATRSAAAPNSPIAAMSELQEGMTPAQVRKLLGEPVKLSILVPLEANAEEWIYTHTVESRVRMVAAETHDVPYIHPITGATQMLKEPIYRQETVVVEKELRLLWIDDLLTHWKIVAKATEQGYH